MSLSNAYENILLDHLFGGQVFTLPTQYAVGLLKNSTFNEVDALIEPSTTLNYSRVLVDNDKTTFTSAPGTGNPQKISNAIEIEFPVVKTADWGNVYYVALFEPGPSGDLIAYGLLDAGVPVDVKEGTKLIFPIGSLEISLD